MGKAIVIPTISFSSNNLGKVTFSNNYEALKITALEDLYISFTNDLAYTNKAYPKWEKYKANTQLFVAEGTTISFRGVLTPDVNKGIGTFSSNGKFNVSGNPLALLKNDLLQVYSFKYLFKDCTKLINAKDLILPYIVLENCYEGMFKGCSSLKTAPKLRASTLAENCYKEIFYNCSSLNIIECYNLTDISNYVPSDWIEGVATTGVFDINFNGEWNSTNKESHIPNGWIIDDDYGRSYEQQYMTIDVITGGKFTVLPARELYDTPFTEDNALTISYKLNDNNWIETKLLDSGLTLDVEVGDKIKFKGNNTYYCNNSQSAGMLTTNIHKQWYVIFGFVDREISGNTNTFLNQNVVFTTATFNVYGNIMSLCYGDNFINKTTLPGSYTFCCLFKNSNVVSAEHLILPAKVLQRCCYRAMFSFAKHLTIAPVLNDATPVTDCYKFIFDNCSSLTKITCLSSTKINTSAFNNWTCGCNNNSNIIFIKNPNTTTGSEPTNTQWKSVNDAVFPQYNSEPDCGIIGNMWTIIDAY